MKTSFQDAENVNIFLHINMQSGDVPYGVTAAKENIERASLAQTIFCESVLILVFSQNA